LVERIDHLSRETVELILNVKPKMELTHEASNLLKEISAELVKQNTLVEENRQLLENLINLNRLNF